MVTQIPARDPDMATVCRRSRWPLPHAMIKADDGLHQGRRVPCFLRCGCGGRDRHGAFGPALVSWKDDGGNPVKSVDIQKTSLDACVADAQSEQVVITRGGLPVALVVGVAGLDEEQVQLGASDEFWRLISARRKERTISREVLESRRDARRDASDGP